MKRKLAGMMCVILMLNLTGCNFTQTSIDSLLAPPKLSEEQSSIYKALTDTVQSPGSISLVYPKTGDYKSAFVLENIDEEDSKEAIVFYRDNSGISGSSAIKINILDQVDGKWVSVTERPVKDATEVQKVSFVKVESLTYIVIGFNITGTDNIRMVKVFQYDNQQNHTEKLKEIDFSKNCAEYEVYDINDDGIQELILLMKTVDQHASQEISAKAYHIQHGEVIEIASTWMDSATINYTNIYKGRLNKHNKIPALFLDAQKGGDMMGTEILVMRNGFLENLMLDNQANLLRSTIRMNGWSSMDFDGNRMYQIPNTKPFPGYDTAALYDQLYLTEWYSYEENEDGWGRLVQQSLKYMDYSLGFSLEIPEKWRGVVTAKKDASNNELVFFTYRDDIKEDSDKLLKIKVFNRTNDDKLPEGYHLLVKNGQLVYAYQLYHGIDSENNLNDADVQQLFTLLQ